MPVSIHTADWIVPITAPPIKKGAVAINEGRILHVGTYKDVCGRLTGTVFHHAKGAIMPALVNAHIHLELSSLKNHLGESEGFIDWLRNLVERRSIPSPSEIKEAMNLAINRLRQTGTILVGDITNTGLSIPVLTSNSVKAVVFLEVVGLNIERAKVHWNQLLNLLTQWSKRINLPITLAAHSPYSVSKEILGQIRDWSETHDQIISVHLAESEEEVIFLMTGGGPLKNLLVDIEAFDPDFNPPGLSPVTYLAKLGFLRDKTLCVHLVHISDEDIQILKQKGAKVCICPLSNDKLKVGLTPLDKLLKAGINPALGTDSLASNEDLNLFREMAYLKSKFPSIHANEILKMGSIYGAAALGMDKILGSIEPGKEAHLIFIPLEVTSLSTIELEEAVIESGLKEKVKWIEK